MGSPIGAAEVERLIRQACARVSLQGQRIIELPDPLERGQELASVGFDSVAMARVADELETELGVVLPFRDILNARTVGDLIDLVCRAGV